MVQATPTHARKVHATEAAAPATTEQAKDPTDTEEHANIDAKICVIGVAGAALRSGGKRYQLSSGHSAK